MTEDKTANRTPFWPGNPHGMGWSLEIWRAMERARKKLLYVPNEGLPDWLSTQHNA